MAKFNAPDGARVLRAVRLHEVADKDGKVTRKRAVVRTDADLADADISKAEYDAAVAGGSIAAPPEKK